MPDAPVRTKPATKPEVKPVRRLNPERVCPDQITRIVRTIEPLLP